MARAINSEVKAGRGTPHGGVFLDIASRLPAEEIKRRLPSMYHQFMELAEVDITKEPMEVGPTCHYVMGGVEVDPDTGAATTPGLFAAGECSGGMHGSNRLGGNSLSDLLVFGRRAGLGAADYVRALSERPTVSDEAVDDAAKLALSPFEDRPTATRRRTPTRCSSTCRQSMNDLVGIIRKADEIAEALDKLDELRERYKRVRVEGGRHVQSGLAPGDRPAQHAAGQRVRRQGRAASAPRAAAATPATTTRRWTRTGATTLLVCRAEGDDGRCPTSAITREDQIPMRPDLLELFELSELEKYFTAEELADHPERRS